MCNFKKHGRATETDINQLTDAQVIDTTMTACKRNGCSGGKRFLGENI